jgi:hypothetical protein
MRCPGAVLHISSQALAGFLVALALRRATTASEHRAAPWGRRWRARTSHFSPVHKEEGKKPMTPADLTKWVDAVKQRDDALKKEGVEVVKASKDRNHAVEKFNGLASKYNDVVKSLIAAQAKLAAK